MTRLFAGTPFDIPPECDDCGRLETECVCTAADKATAQSARQRVAARLPASEQTATVKLEKRKGNRSVTVVSGLTAQANDLADVLTQLQTDCGTGGTVKSKSETIELQGDHAEATRTALRKIGYRVV